MMPTGRMISWSVSALMRSGTPPLSLVPGPRMRRGDPRSTPGIRARRLARDVGGRAAGSVANRGGRDAGGRTAPAPASRRSFPYPSRIVTHRRALGCLIEVVETAVLTAIVVLQTFVAQPFQVQQVSMMNTIDDGQYVLVDKLTPRFDGYHRGDIIVFSPPANAEVEAGKPYIKRIVGVGGDTVSLRDGHVFV